MEEDNKILGCDYIKIKYIEKELKDEKGCNKMEVLQKKRFIGKRFTGSFAKILGN